MAVEPAPGAAPPLLVAPPAVLVLLFLVMRPTLHAPVALGRVGLRTAPAAQVNGRARCAVAAGIPLGG